METRTPTENPPQYKLSKKATEFLMRMPATREWRTFKNDAPTRKLVGELAARGLVECNRFNQVRYRAPDRDEAVDRKVYETVTLDGIVRPFYAF